jgi:hypothetical protein
MKKLIKLFIITALILIPTLVLTSCDSKGLPEGFDQDEVAEAAKDIASLANNRDYAAVHARIDEPLQGGVSIEQLKKDWDPLLNKSADFVDFDEVTFGSETDENDVVYALGIVTCNYEDGTRIYTFYFNENMTLSGLSLQ